MHALAKFRQYLVGGKFCIKTDHNSLRHFLGQRDFNDKQQKWVSKLQVYDFDISYVKGTLNVVANALSHRPHLNAMIQISEDRRHLIIVEYVRDSWASGIVDGIVVDTRYTLVDDLIIYKNRIFLVPGLKVKRIFMRELHDSPIARHPGYFKMYRQVRERFTWKGLKENVV